MTRRRRDGPKKLVGRWRICEMEFWCRDALDLVRPAFIEYRAGRTGNFGFSAVEGRMDCREATIDDRPGLEFSWEGNDEFDPASKRGWAALEPDACLEGHIFFHMGEDSALRAEREETQNCLQAAIPDGASRRVLVTRFLVWKTAMADSSTAAILEEEAIYRLVRGAFCLSIWVLVVPLLGQCVKIVVVVRETVPDVGPDAESSPIVERELARPTDSAAAYDGSVGRGLLGDSPFESLVFRSEGEEAPDGPFQLLSVAIFLPLTGPSSEGTLGRPSPCRLLGAHPSCRNGVARRPKSKELTMLTMPASRLPRQPIDTCSLDGAGEECIAGLQELPAGISTSRCSGFH